MKRIYKTVSICLLIFLTNQVKSQNADKLIGPDKSTDKISGFKQGYYIIAGVFDIPENARIYSNRLKTSGFKPLVISSSYNHKSYVSLEYSPDVAPLNKKLLQLKNTEALKNAWILKIANKNSSEAGINSTITKNSRKKNILSHTHNHYKLFINVHDNKNNPVSSSIKIINGEKATVAAQVSANTFASIAYPKRENQTVQLTCEVFGFHKAIIDLKLNDPVNEQTLRKVKRSGDTIFVDMLLEKPKKGDIMAMYNVFFFPNSNAIRESSNYELRQLLTLLKENPELTIKIHGHTNGSMLGKFKKIKETDNIFSYNDYSMKFGNSGTLSKLRAHTIKRFLVLNNIDKTRIKIKGWGGRRMIHRQFSPLAEYNIRVEIEILND